MEEKCPKCDVSLQGEPIRPEHRAAGMYGETDDDAPRFYSRTIAVEIPHVYDGGLFFQCPDCGGRWHRFPEGHRLRRVAAAYVDAPARR